MSEYQDLLAAALQRRDAQLAERHVYIRARGILAAAGWNASSRQLEAAAELDGQVREEERQAVVIRALQLQQDPRARGRHVRPEATMPRGQAPPATTREQIRRYIAERRQQDPRLKATAAHLEVLRQFGVELSLNAFYVSYWGGKNGERLPKVNGKPARTLGKAAPEHSRIIPASPAPAPAPPPDPVVRTEAAAGPFSLEQTPTGVRVRLDLLTGPHGAAIMAQLIGLGLNLIYSPIPAEAGHP